MLMLCMAIFLIVEVKEDTLYFMLVKIENAPYYAGTLKKIQRIVQSSLATETLSLSNAVDTTIFLNKMFSGIYFEGQKDLPIEVVTDSQSLYDALYSCKRISERRLRIDNGMLKEVILRKEI